MIGLTTQQKIMLGKKCKITKQVFIISILIATLKILLNSNIKELTLQNKLNKGLKDIKSVTKNNTKKRVLVSTFITIILLYLLIKIAKCF